MITTGPDKRASLDIRPLDLVNIKDILGCLYYVCSKDIEVIVGRLEKDYNVSSKIFDIDKKKGTITVKTEEDVYFKQKEKIKISFIINSMRYSFNTVISSFGDDMEIIFGIPNVISHDEHRILPRINLPESMNNCLELVTGIFSGVRIKGKVEDISLGGLGFTPNNIENVRNSDEVDLKDTKIRPGDRFRKLKFEIDDDILDIPVEVCHTPSDERETFGLKFDLDKGRHGKRLREFLQSCIPQKKVINFASFYDKIKSKF